MADRSVLVRLRADISDFQRKFATAGTTTSVFVKNLESADSRMGNLVQTALALGPALVPISAVAVPALVGLTGQVGAAAAGVAVLVAAFNGVGDALEAVNKYQLDPTDENLKKMREEMRKLPAEGRDFVRFLDQEVLPSLDLLQDKAAAGVLPGFEDSISSLMRRLPELSGLVEDIAERSGNLAADAGAAVASDDFDDFFEFLRTEASPTLDVFARTIGNLLEGTAKSLMGLNPLANDFEQGLLAWSEGFADIDPSDFNEFVDYVRQNGPAALDALSAIGGGIVAIVKAAAPVGAVTLPAIEALANVIEVIAESPAGPVLIGTAAGLAAISRSIALFQAANGSALLSTIKGVKAEGPGAAAAAGGVAASYARMEKGMQALKTGVPVVAGMALAYSDLDDKAGLSNTAMLATAGLLIGPWGAAIGGAAGLFLDYKAAGAQAEEQTRAFNASLETMSLDQLRNGLTEVNSLIAGVEGVGGITNDALAPLLSERKAAIEDQIVVTEKLEAARAAQRRTETMAYAEEIGLNLKASESTKMTTEQIKAQADAVREVRDAGRQAAESFLAYGDSLDDSKTSLSEWLTEQEESASALRNFNTNALRAAKNGLDDGLIVSLQNAGEQGALRMKQLADATDEQIGRANKAWRRGQAEMERTQDIAQRLANSSPVRVELNADTGRAITNLKSLENYLKSIKDEDVFVNIRHRQYGQSGGFGPVDSADGSMVPKDGGPYTDRFLYRLAPGEEIITNRHGEADRFRADRAAGRIPGYASGGTTGKKPKHGSKAVFDSASEIGFTGADIRDLIAAAEAQQNAAGRQADAAEVAALAAKDQLAAAEKGAQTAEDNLRAAQQAYDTFKAQVANQYNSKLTGGGLAGLTQTLARDTNASNSTNATLQALIGAGLDTTGPAAGLFRELAASDDQQTLNELLAAGPDYITMLEEQYAAREASNDSRALVAAEATYGPIVAEQQAALAVANAQLAIAQNDSTRAEQRAAMLSGQVDGLQNQVGQLAGQLADALNGVASQSGRAAPRSSAQVGRWR